MLSPRPSPRAAADTEKYFVGQQIQLAVKRNLMLSVLCKINEAENQTPSHLLKCFSEQETFDTLRTSGRQHTAVNIFPSQATALLVGPPCSNRGVVPMALSSQQVVPLTTWLGGLGGQDGEHVRQSCFFFFVQFWPAADSWTDGLSFSCSEAEISDPESGG